ncbi:hypothetical protein [Tsukamurella ocularis]|uniref:hypothetical protein n=1 Tax=Tsukamurella ocularis TaxID=1970234 RepID=UPI0021677138|nr:hypothetical protein [Tsukamurella ocularis]MCS3778434.1 hypothetical protein [Tsukamurella ocularis]MCS3789135.1 hypothetical protein [Tsukamurella ocularis]MCS3852986.1 hypothetical protein [Tsukamurella ocularis]
MSDRNREAATDVRSPHAARERAVLAGRRVRVTRDEFLWYAPVPLWEPADVP